MAVEHPSQLLTKASVSQCLELDWRDLGSSAAGWKPAIRTCQRQAPGRNEQVEQLSDDVPGLGRNRSEVDADEIATDVLEPARMPRDAPMSLPSERVAGVLDAC